MLPSALRRAAATTATMTMTNGAASASTFSRLVRFLPKTSGAASSSSTPTPLIGEPKKKEQDVGLASYRDEPIEVEVFSGTSILSPGQRTGEIRQVGRLLSPLASTEVGTIRCIGLNYISHAKEVNLDIPKVPVLFMKPATALAGPYPNPVVIPRAYAADDAADYESEIALVIGKDCKNVGEGEALDYLLGITAANDVSSRKAQFAQSQWCYSKSFDGACPIGPAFVPRSQFATTLGQVAIEGKLNDETVQKSALDDLIFSLPKLISFLSQGTTLPAGTLILTGTPAGVGWTKEPRKLLRPGGVFSVYVSHGVGTLINRIEEDTA